MSNKGREALVSPKEVLRELMKSAGSGLFKAFLQSRLADDMQGAVAPRYELSKAETIKRVTEIFSMAAGGSATMLSNLEEGASGCCRILLSSSKQDLTSAKSLNLETTTVFEGAIWIDLHPDGTIARLNLVGDSLTPALTMGRQLARA